MFSTRKPGTGQYFVSPPPHPHGMPCLMKLQLGERCNDSACGTFGLMIVAHQKED